MSIGEAIRARREERGISQRGLAAAAGVSGAFISQIENGRRQPSLEVLTRIGEALGTPPGSLVASGIAPVDPPPVTMHAAVSLAEVEALVHDPTACHQLVAAARSLVAGPRGEQLGAYSLTVTEYADMLEAFAKKRYRTMTGAAIIVLTSALSYVVDPADAWPDAHPHGHIDDVGVLAFTRALVGGELEDFQAWQRES